MISLIGRSLRFVPLVVLIALGATAASAQDALGDGPALPITPSPFAGVIEKTFAGSKQDFPQPVRPQSGPRTASS